MNKKIVFTGGGTAGHVTPNIALLPFLKKENHASVAVKKEITYEYCNQWQKLGYCANGKGLATWLGRQNAAKLACIATRATNCKI